MVLVKNQLDSDHEKFPPGTRNQSIWSLIFFLFYIIIISVYTRVLLVLVMQIIGLLLLPLLYCCFITVIMLLVHNVLPVHLLLLHLLPESTRLKLLPSELHHQMNLQASWSAT